MTRRWMCTDCLADGLEAPPGSCPGCGADGCFITGAGDTAGSLKARWDQVWDHVMDMVDEAEGVAHSEDALRAVAWERFTELLQETPEAEGAVVSWLRRQDCSPEDPESALFELQNQRHG